MIEDRPYFPRHEPRHPWLIALAVVVALLACAAAWRYFTLDEQKVAVAPPKPPEEAPPAKVEPAPAPVEPSFVTRREPSVSLPSLEQSDAMVRNAISGLVGEKAFNNFVIPKDLVRRIVATVDNLPRSTAPRRVMPLNAARGAFLVTQSDAPLRIDAGNSLRYAPYVRVFEAVDARTLVRNYIDAYPLFQKAYEELGYPGKYFHDRLLEAINNLLDAPELNSPATLNRAKVLYEFADPDLEARSAGQKIMIRMGTDNELAVKAKLRELRRELLAAGEHRQ